MLELNRKKTVVYELNEVPRRVLEDFVARHPRSEFAEVLRRGRFAETQTSDAGILSPWSTWPTLHRGVTNEQHLITDFGQDLEQVDDEYPPIWKLLAERGVRVGMFGSLHSYPLPEKQDGYAFYLPDTFAQGPEAFPAALQEFQSFNLSMVDASGRNVSGGLPLGKVARLARHVPTLGFRLSTGLSVAKQLASEALERARKVRRRTTQSQLAFDVYEKQLWKTTPDYSAFFTNHVASSMHRYWPGAFPEDYQNKELPPEWHAKYSGEVDYTMSVADQQLGRLRRFVERHPGYALMVVSSMGQEAVDTDLVIRHLLLAEDLGLFLGALGLAAEDWQSRRAMLPRYVVQVAESKVDATRDALASVTVQGEPLTWAEHDRGVFMIKFGQRNVPEDELRITLGGREVEPASVGLGNVEVQDSTGAYAYHVPEGVFLYYDPAQPEGETVDAKIDTTEIAPALLRNFELEPLAHMGV